MELGEGFQGPLTRSEPLFYGLDTLPLFIAISVYIPFWPGRFIDDNQLKHIPGEGEKVNDREEGTRSTSTA